MSEIVEMTKEEKITKLTKFVSNEEAEKIWKKTVFDQDELERFVKSESTIYLLGDKFKIDVEKKIYCKKSYIGVNNPVVKIDSKKVEDFNLKKIVFQNISYDEDYEGIIDDHLIGVTPIITINIKDTILAETKEINLSGNKVYSNEKISLKCYYEGFALKVYSDDKRYSYGTFSLDNVSEKTPTKILNKVQKHLSNKNTVILLTPPGPLPSEEELKKSLPKILHDMNISFNIIK